jgi:1,4-alpha-glucan branching enzyme
MIATLNRFYIEQPALWEWDNDWRGYEWIDFSDWEKSIISYMRKAEDSYLVCVHNFTPEYWPDYQIPLKGAKKIIEVFNSDHEDFGGSHKINPEVSENFRIHMPPLATMIFEIKFV